MKKRKTALLGFLLTAMLGIGVGYAAVTDVLDVTGTVEITEEAAAKEFDTEVYFTKAEVVGEDNQLEIATANINTNNNDKASFTVKGLSDANDKIEIKYTIYNESERTVELKLRFDDTVKYDGNGVYTSSDGCFTITNDIANQTVQLAKDTTYATTFTINWIKTPTKMINETVTFVIEATAVA